VVIENLTKKFGKALVLDHINLKINAKEYFVLLGPSGSGKTTLLRLIAGIEDVTEGNIYIGGKNVTDLSPKERNIAMVFQNYALYPFMSVFDNISLPLRVKGISKAKTAEKVREVSQTLHIRELLEKKPRQISGGEQQRVALARALVRDPTVFLLDEPLSNLDAKLRVEARAFLKRLQKELGITTIFVTHDQSEATTMATKIAVLNRGSISQVDDPYGLYSRPNDVFTAGFVGSPAMNMVLGTASKSGAEWVFSNEDLKLGLGRVELDSERKVYLGIRPEHIRFVGQDQGFSCTVSNVEPFGSLTYVTVSIGKTSFVVQLSGRSVLEAGSSARVDFDPEDVLLFGGDNGKRLGINPSDEASDKSKVANSNE
jgi:multiple sugar transport system ATP-binding protein